VIRPGKLLTSTEIEEMALVTSDDIRRAKARASRDIPRAKAMLEANLIDPTEGAMEIFPDSDG